MGQAAPRADQASRINQLQVLVAATNELLDLDLLRLQDSEHRPRRHQRRAINHWLIAFPDLSVGEARARPDHQIPHHDLHLLDFQLRFIVIGVLRLTWHHRGYRPEHDWIGQHPESDQNARHFLLQHATDLRQSRELDHLVDLRGDHLGHVHVGK